MIFDIFLVVNKLNEESRNRPNIDPVVEPESGKLFVSLCAAETVKDTCFT